MNKIIIQQLTAKSVEKDYSVKFHRGLNVIAGESMTGKTSVLQLINYCFGDSEYPQTAEFQKLIIALLELEVNEEPFTIQRQLSKKKTALIHFCRINELKNSHKTIEVMVEISQRENEESISSFILSKLGLKGMELKIAPSQEASETNTLSFRDLLWLCYLKRSRVGGEQLLFENEYWKHNKLIQVFDIIFNIYSNTATLLSADLEKIKAEIQDNEQKSRTITDFLDQQGVLPTQELTKDAERLEDETKQLKMRLTQIDSVLAGSSDTAKGLRQEVLSLQTILQKLRTERRGMEKNLLLLIPLRSQYNEDIRKLTFLNEAKEVMDPLLILLCPYCLKPIDKNLDGKSCCPVCKQELKKVETNTRVDVTREIGIIKRKLDELNGYVEEVEKRKKENENKDKEVSEKLGYLSNELDQSMKSYVTPYLAERDQLKTTIVTNENRIMSIQSDLNFRKQISTIQQEVIKLKDKAEQLKVEIKSESLKSVARTDLIRSLSSTFYQQLNAIHFPKLGGIGSAWIDDKLVPYVKHVRYDKLSSEGAINLTAICWMTTIFEEAIKRSMHHPGFLILDYIQAGIGMGPEVKEEEFKDVSIVKGLYTILEEVSELEPDSQVIAVDNHPPPYADKYVIVRYTRDPTKYPYGFISDETGVNDEVSVGTL